MEASLTIVVLSRLRSLAAPAFALVLALAACGTGVQDEKGWQKVLERDYPCEELRDVAEQLPSSIDRQQVAADLRRAGCEPPEAAPVQGR